MTKNLVNQLLLPLPPGIQAETPVFLPAWAIDLMIEAANRIRTLEMALGVTAAAAKDVHTLEYSPTCGCDICGRVSRHLSVAGGVAAAALAGEEEEPKGPLWRAFDPLMESVLKLPEDTIGKRAALQAVAALRSRMQGSQDPGVLTPTRAVTAYPQVLTQNFGRLLVQIENLADDLDAKPLILNEIRRLHLAFSPPGTPVLMTEIPQSPSEMTP